MLSLRQHLEHDADGLQILLRVAQVLVEGMAKHTIAYEPEAYERFSNKMLDLAAQFTERISGSDCLVHAGAAVRALDDYTEVATLDLKKLAAK